MPLKTPSRRTKPSLPLKVEYSKKFEKDWIRLERSGVCNMDRLKDLILKLIANAGPLDPIHREHELQGDYAGYLECHMGGDVLLIYERSDTGIVFERAGSHNALFNE